MFIALIILLPVAYWIQLRRMEIKTKRPNWNESAEREWGRKIKQQQQWKLSDAFPYFEYIYFASNMSLLLNLRDLTLLIFTFSVFAVSRCCPCVCVFLLCDRLLWAFNACIKMEYTFSLSLGHHFKRPSTNNLINFNRAHDNNNESEKLISRKLKLCKRSHLINGNSLRIFHFSLFIELLGEFLGEFGVCVWPHCRCMWVCD